MKFTFDVSEPQQQYISITAELKCENEKTRIFFPIWRPGRYEVGNFIKNTNHFRVYDENGKKIEFKKDSLHSWLVDTENTNKITVKYSYYAAELNAGSTFLDATQLYVNPVNCCIFTEEEFGEPIEVKLDIPENWEIAHSLNVENHTFIAQNYDELADNPFICSSQLQSRSYQVGETTFYVWFNGVVKPNWEKLLNDFQKFTETQMKQFLKFPTSEYHFLFQISPYKVYHGVEHSKSTVIALGPSYAVFEEFYTELLGVSSHELYHTWNVKSIRPSDWMPYDFSKESPSELGYIAEGITTYMGDYMLYKSGVFSVDQYFLEMQAQLNKHYHNFGRFNYSVAQSSYDTWLDGYVPGVPGRKVSIYTEGCLLAFIMDVYILKNTNNKKSLSDVMRHLYHNFGENGIGVTEKDYQESIENITNTSIQWFFDDYIHGTNDYTSLLIDSFEYLGIELYTQPDASEMASKLGVKMELHENNHVFQAFYPGGPMDKAGGMIGDKLLAINGISLIQNDVERWVRFFQDEEKEILVERGGKIIALKIPETSRIYYQNYYLKLVENPTKSQVIAFKKWSE